MKKFLSIQQKLIVLLLTTVTLSLILAGALLAFLQYQLYQQETADKIREGHITLVHNLQTIENDLLINGAELSQDESIISLITLITDHQSDQESQTGRPDVDKKKLVTRLAERVVLADFDLISVYDAAGNLLTFSMQKDFGFLLGIVSFPDKTEPLVFLSGSTSHDFWTASPLPSMVTDKIRKRGNELDIIQYIRVENGFDMVATLPIVTMLPDNRAKTIGYVEVSNFLGKDFASKISKQTQLNFQLITPDVNIGNLQLNNYQHLLAQHSPSINNNPRREANYTGEENYSFHSHSLLLHDNSHVYFVFGRGKEILKKQLSNMVYVILLVLLCTALVCIPLGIYAARRTIITPLSSLLAGVHALKKGADEKPLSIGDSGEIGELAQAFNEMGLAIQQRETGLKKAREEWERTFDSTTDIMTIQDREFRVVLANQATCDFLNLSRQKIEGNFCHKLFHDREEPCLDCPTLATLKDNKPHSAEMRCVLQHKVLLFSSSPIFDDQGECSGIVYSAKDITKTRELEGKLRQAQKMEAIGTLAGGIAHDFNNILTPILGYSEMLMASLPKDSLEREHEEQVVRAANRARDLVKQILTFSRQNEHERSPVQVHLIVKEALKLMRSSIPANIDIETKIADDCCYVLADPSQIHQMLLNLCTNAYHAMRETGGNLVVTISRITIAPDDYTEDFALKAGTWLKLTVSDTGVGMDKQHVEKIFDPYFTTKKKGEGTGLGLSVVHGIVKSHQAHITVYSEPGIGSEFNVYFPCVQDMVPTTVPLPAPQDIPTGHQERLLIVDDEEPVAGLLKRILEQLNYEVTAVSGSAKALEIFKEKHTDIDLVLTDMSMPGMSGAQLATELLKIKPGLPIVLCTGFSEVVNEENASDMGFSGFLLKPVFKSQLANAVSTALEKNHEDC
jgi:PAS domain S-box-containing protein